MGISTSKDMNPSAANRNEGTKVISATFSLPFVLGLNGDEWVGNQALPHWSKLIRYPEL